MKSKDGFVQAYNAQAAVDAEAQIAVAQDVTQDVNDKQQLVPMTDAIKTNLGRKPGQLSADSGYCSDANLEALETRGIDGYIATGRAKNAAAGTAEASAAAPPADACPAASPEPARAQRASRPCARKSRPAVTTARTGSAQQLPEPVFGQIEQARGLPPIPRRGIEKVQAELGHCPARPHPPKMAQGRILSAARSMALEARLAVAETDPVATLGVRPAA